MTYFGPKMDSLRVADNRFSTFLRSRNSNLNKKKRILTLIVLYICYAQQEGFDSVVVRTPDTDILSILLFHAPDLTITIYIDIGTGAIFLKIIA